MSKPTIRVVARFIALPDQVEQLKSLLLSVIEPSRQDAGCIQYELLQNQADPTDFTFVEEWESNDLLDLHLAAPHIQTALPQLEGIIDEAPDIRCYQLLA